ncbi:fimbrial protein [Moellerella wisconsensis]|uniref:fimbrial protein n=1 Tax=Moellerella wisconsensis TaxID=158849 RepID=UPI001F4D9CA0|nr:fimbrial protein [Moellerella wisconsensis]UNH41253.1 type 1 fimbrial protein [Moellerella wisconsensis]WJW80749.1 fimbrial protein [Moellerella wisconsensis]
MRSKHINTGLVVYFLLILSAFSTPVLADLGVINLRINATIVLNTCRVSTQSINQTVNLGTWASRQFYAGPTAVTAAVPFAILLEDCGAAAKQAKVRFSGIKDSKNNALFALNANSTAYNVAVELLDSKMRRIHPDLHSMPYNLTPNAQHVTLQFYARYMATERPVRAGSANAEATFEMIYD